MVKRVMGIVVLLLVNATFGWAQGPAFEVASVNPGAPRGRGGSGYVAGADPRRIARTPTNLQSLLVDAYKVKFYQIVEPDWFETELYDLMAKAPDNAPIEQIPTMLQTLLAERFKLRVHRETKTVPVYALVVGKNGPKLEKVKGAGPTGISFGFPFEVRGVNMTRFTSVLSGYMDRPVLDLTELAGDFDFDLRFNVRALMAMKSGGQAPADTATMPSIFEAIQEIGLKLEPRIVPMEMLVVDSAQKVPSEN